MKKYQDHLIGLLNDRRVPFADSENTVAVDGLTIKFNAKEYQIHAHMYSDTIANMASQGQIIIGKFGYSDTGLDVLTGVAEMAQECMRWRKMPGFNVPEIVFAFGARTFLKNVKYWKESEYMSMCALYLVRGINTNHETYRRLINDAGTKAKFIGDKKPFLLKQKDFMRISSQPFQVYAESAYKPIQSLPVDPNMVLAWFERRQRTVVSNKEQCEAVGIAVGEERILTDNFLVCVPRDQMPTPLIFPYEWDSKA